MRYNTIIFSLILLAVFMFDLPASAKTMYVGDELVITLRIGKSTDHKIIKTLKTGTPLEVLEEDKTYLKVKTPDGAVGYVLRQYVSSETPKTQIIEKLERLNDSLQKKVSTLEAANSSLEKQLKTVQGDYSQEISGINEKSAELEKNLEQALANERVVTEKYNTLLTQSEKVIEIAAERDLLSEQNKKLKADFAALAATNEKLSDSRMVKWFLAGGGVFLFGWIIGKISRKKRSRF